MRKAINLLLTFVLCIFNLNASFTAYGEEYPWESNDGYPVVTKSEMYYELSEKSPYYGQMLTYGINSDGDIVRITENEIDSSEAQRSKGNSITKIITVLVGKTLVGYLQSTVVDGMVVAVSGKSGAEWVAYAVDQILNQPYSSTLILNKETVCIAYPPYGGWKPDYCR